MKTDSLILHPLLHSADLVEEALRRRLDLIGLRPRQARVIDALSRMEPASQVALAREFAITPASMSTMTARLIDAGLISREVDPSEARSNLLRLTDRGRGLLSEIHIAWSEIDAMISQLVGPENAAELSRQTKNLREKLGGHVPGQCKSPSERTR